MELVTEGLLCAHTIMHLQYVDGYGDLVYNNCVGTIHIVAACSITCQKWDNSDNLGQFC